MVIGRTRGFRNWNWVQSFTLYIFRTGVFVHDAYKFVTSCHDVVITLIADLNVAHSAAARDLDHAERRQILSLIQMTFFVSQCQSVCIALPGMH